MFGSVWPFTVDICVLIVSCIVYPAVRGAIAYSTVDRRRTVGGDGLRGYFHRGRWTVGRHHCRVHVDLFLDQTRVARRRCMLRRLSIQRDRICTIQPNGVSFANKPTRLDRVHRQSRIGHVLKT